MNRHFERNNNHRWLVLLLGSALLGAVLLIAWQFERDGHDGIWRNSEHTSDMMQSLLRDEAAKAADKLAMIHQMLAAEPRLVEAVAAHDAAGIDERAHFIQQTSSGFVDGFHVYRPDGKVIYSHHHGAVQPPTQSFFRARETGQRAFGMETHGDSDIHVHLAGPLYRNGEVIAYVNLSTSLNPYLDGINALLRLEMEQHAEHGQPGDTAIAIFRDVPPGGQAEAPMAISGRFPTALGGYVRALLNAGQVRGETKTHQVTVSPLRDVNGQPVARAVLVLDVSTAAASSHAHIGQVVLVMTIGALLLVLLAYWLLERNAERNRGQAQVLVDALTTAEAATRAKSEFLANMSHEIRTPMNAVIGMSALCLQEPLADKSRDYVAKIHSAARHLLGILNDILDLSKVEAGKLQIEQVDFRLAEVLEGVSGLAGSLAAGKAVRFRIDLAADVPQIMRGDPLRLTQVLNNLVGNALKFTERGEVAVRIGLEGAASGGEDDARRVRFAVRDTGIGLSETQIARLFRPFTQADTTATRKYGGTGLGLVISQRLIDLMGGTLSVESTLGVGSTFQFALDPGPARLVEAASTVPAPAEAPVTAPDFSGRRILLVEDNELNQIVARDFLAQTGAAVGIAGNGREGLDMALGARWDAILMDMQMPVMDGLSATLAIRQQVSGDLPIIALTAHALAEERARCLAAGMNDFVTKPFNPRTFFETLARWIEAGARTAAQAASAAVTGDAAAVPPEPAPAREAAPMVAAAATFDPALMLDAASGDPVLVTKWLRIFVSTSREVPAELRARVQQGDAEWVGETAHRLKGAAGWIGAAGLVEQALRAERAARGTQSDWPALGLQLADDLDAMLAHVGLHLARS